ncbi:hypothetical protein AYO44_07665 [Planctomycetaceae bacterium SCGC AG-212-F19]|nr:hypothetical protein AYO44_07665 [Planctomycetaceae bacterium SCGC AG-212-F19]
MALTAWNQLDDVYAMRLVYEQTGRTIGARRCRLFLCACCRRIPCVPTDEAMCSLLDLAERAADGLVKHKALATAIDSAKAAPGVTDLDATQAYARKMASALVVSAATPRTLTWTNTWSLVCSVCHAVACCEARVGEPRFSQLTAAEGRAQAVLFAHILGDPFRAVTHPEEWPAAVLSLAQALYDGTPCAFALHDALAEAGLAEWAEHFRSPDHPKGCWALDDILGKR